MFKVMMFMRKRPGLTFDEFQARYEGGHVALAGRLAREGLAPRPLTYRRNYILRNDPYTAAEIGFDCVTEAVFSDRSDWDALMEGFHPDSATGRLRKEDLDLWMDPGSLRFAVVAVHEGYNAER